MPSMRAPGTGGGFQLISLDDYYDSVVKAGASPPVGPPPKPKKMPRQLHAQTAGPTTRMKPISDEEAMANIRSGAYRSEKSVKSLRWLAALKALSTGYSKVSGGGALKAPNRGDPLDLNLSVDDLARAVEGGASPGRRRRHQVP